METIFDKHNCGASRQTAQLTTIEREGCASCQSRVGYRVWVLLSVVVSVCVCFARKFLLHGVMTTVLAVVSKGR